MIGTRFPVRVTAVLIACAILIASAGAWLHSSQKNDLLQSAERDLAAIGSLKADQITAWRSDLLADGEVLLLGEGLAEDVARTLSDGNPAAGERLLRRFSGLLDIRDWHAAMLVDSSGTVLLSSSSRPLDSLCGEEIATALREALDAGVPVLTDLHTDQPGGVLHLTLLLPFPGAVNRAQVSGGIVLQIDPGEFLFPLVEFWPVSRRTAETLIVRAEGDSVLFLNSPRHAEGEGFSLSLPLTRTEVPAVQAVLGRTGVLRGIDYRGVEVLSVIVPIEGSPWFMISKIDRAEALERWGLVSGLILGMTVITLLAVSGSILVLWQRRERLQYRRLLETERALRGSEIHREHLLGCLMAIRNVNQLITQVDEPGELIRATCLELTANLSFTGAWIALLPWEGMPALSASAPADGPPFDPFAPGPGDPPIDCLEQAFAAGGSISVALGKCPYSGCPVRPLSGSCRVLAHALRKDGERFGILVVTLPEEYSRDVEVVGLFDEVAGDLSFALAKLREAAARRRVEAALAKSEKTHRRLFENAPLGIFRMTADGGTLDVNPELARMLGCSSPADVLRDYPNLGTDLCSDPEYRGRFAALLGECGEVKDFEFEGILRDGNRKWFSMNARIREEAGSDSAHIDGFIVDVTGNRLAEEEKSRLEGQLRQAQKLEAIGRLAGGVAHDFNNMLQSILGYTEMALQEAVDGSAIAEMLGEIRKAGRRSAELTGQLLAFARKQTVSPQVLDLNGAVAGMLNLLGRLIGEDIELSWSPGAEVRPVLIDPAQLGQLLANLTVNSRDAIAGTGSLTLETGTAVLDAAYCADHPGSLPGAYSVLSVSDDGCGMDRATIAMIFEPFFTTKPPGKGTGLGLATVWGIAKQNGGFVNVYSEPDRGSTFRIYLPWFEGEPSPPQLRSDAAPVAPGGGERILVVEDDRTLLQLSARMLQDSGYEVLTAASPSEAMEVIRTASAGVDLLLTDVVMPGMSGRDLYEVLKPGCPLLACLYMSGYTANVITHHGVLDSGVHFLQKPFSREELVAKIREVLDDSRDL